MTDRPADEALFEAAFRDSAIGTALLTPVGHLLKANDAFCALLGYTQEQLLTLEVTSITHADDRASDRARVQSLLESGSNSQRVEKRCLHSAGHVIWVRERLSIARDSEHKPLCLVLQIEDISEQHRIETEARLFFDSSLDLLAIAHEGRLVRVNPAWETVLGYSAEELTEKPFLEFVHEEDHERTMTGVAELLTGNPVRAFRNRYRAKDGSIHWLDWNGQAGEDGRLFCIARDVTDVVAHEELRGRLEEEIRQAALVDALTGVYNRRGFFLLAEQALRAAGRHQRPHVLCFFDLNGLKEINDQLGHDQGDEALLDISDILRHVFRSSDILGRLGGDEFVALAEGDGNVESSLRQRMGDEISRHNDEAGRSYKLATSMGIAVYDPRRPSSLSELLQRADRQMYEQKRFTRRSLAEQQA